MKNCLLSEIGEFNLIDRIKKRIITDKANINPIVDIGDDAFVAGLSKGHLLVSTKDLLVENVHFNLNWIKPEQLGYKAMAVNLSDLAAMGKCRPLYGLIGLALPKNVSVDFVDKLYTGLYTISKKYGLKIAGGDTVSIKKDIVISITLIGEIEQKNILARACGQLGDNIFISGEFGDSAAGLHILKSGKKITKPYQRYLVNKHFLPEPRFDVSSLLAGKANSMIDSSDGLAASVRIIAESSNLGARIDLEKIAISSQLKKLSEEDKSVNPVEMALFGGEDYELVFTAKPENSKYICSAIPGVVKIGEIVKKEEGIKYYLNGRQKNFKQAEFKHFKL